MTSPSQAASARYAVFCALLTAPMASALAVCIYNGFDGGIRLFLIPFIYALLPTFILGLPFYWLCKGNGWTQWWVSIIGGFLIGSIPLSLIALSFGPGDDPVFFFTGIFLPLGALGAIGGFSAWCVWRFMTRQK